MGSSLDLFQSDVLGSPDILGSTRLVTSSSGSVVFSDNYQPYGQDNTSVSGEAVKYTGKSVSSNNGFYYYYQRWYDPSIGRFISQDPLPGHLSDPESLNYYVYVRNSPATNVDPTGRLFLEALIGAGIGAAIGYGWCVASGGGWTSAECGDAALGGAMAGAIFGLTDGASAIVQGLGDATVAAACEEECPNLAEAISSDLTSADTPATQSDTPNTGCLCPNDLPVSGTPGASSPGITSESSLPDDALVVRGGLSEPQTLQANLERGGISANSAPGTSVEELSKGLARYNSIGVTTAGDIRAIGGDVIPSPTATNLFHATIMLGPGGTQELSALFEIMPNPWARVPQ